MRSTKKEYSTFTRWHNERKLLHREDGPAELYHDGRWCWWYNGRRHRVGAPAERMGNGTLVWWVNGQKHRIDGPAVERAKGNNEFWVYGKRLKNPLDIVKFRFKISSIERVRHTEALAKNLVTLCVKNREKLMRRDTPDGINHEIGLLIAELYKLGLPVDNTEIPF